MTSFARAAVLSFKLSPAWWVLPAFLGLEAGVVAIEGHEWSSEWRWTIDWAGAGVFLSAPLAGGVAAWQAQAVGLGLGEAADAMGRRWRLFVTTAGPVFATALAAHLLVVAAMVATAYRNGLDGVAPLLPVGLHALMIAACVAIGSLCGRFVTSRLTAPLVVGALLLYVIQASNGTLPVLWVEVAGATAPLTALRLRPEVVAAQAVLLSGAVVAALALARGRGGIRRGAPVAVAAGVTALGAAGFLAVTEQNRFFTPEASALSYSCVGAAPELCFLDGGEVWAEQAQSVMADLHRVSGVSDTLPERYVQASGEEQPPMPGREFVVGPGTIVDGQVQPDLLARYVVWDRRCLMADEPPPATAIDLLSGLEAVLVARLSPQTPHDDRLLAAFTALPDQAQQQWIRTALGASSTCSFDDIPDWLRTS